MPNWIAAKSFFVWETPNFIAAKIVDLQYPIVFSAHLPSIQYSTSDVRRFPQRSASRDLQGYTRETGLNITKQISVQCKVCTCVTMPCYKCLNYKGCWGGRRLGNKWEANCKKTDKQRNKKCCWGYDRNLSTKPNVTVYPSHPYIYMYVFDQHLDLKL